MSHTHVDRYTFINNMRIYTFKFVVMVTDPLVVEDESLMTGLDNSFLIFHNKHILPMIIHVQFRNVLYIHSVW